MELIQSPEFQKIVKKLHDNQKRDLKKALQNIIDHPEIGEMKRADLSGVRVYKFSMVKQSTLLAYEYEADSIYLIALGSHENFYRDIKR